METKSTLRWYRNKKRIGKEEWSTGDWGSKLLFKARSVTLEVNGRNREEQMQGCQACGTSREGDPGTFYNRVRSTNTVDKGRN